MSTVDRTPVDRTTTDRVPAERFRALFEPRGVLVAGASTHPGKFGFVSLHNILACGYEGKVFATNRDGAEVLGIQTVADIDELPDGEIDLVFVCTPAAANPDLLRACAKKGITAAFIASAGYGEAGEAGLAAQADLVALADELGILLAGPNGQGVVSPPAKLCAQIVGPFPPAGHIGIASQSGNFVSSFENYAQLTGVGVSRAVSAGNAAAVGVPDYLEYYADDPETRVALAYVESVGDGRAFVERLRGVAERKPVVVVKGGATAGGQRAAASHTGALASDDRVFDGAVRQAGVSRAVSVEEGFEVAATFASQPLPAGNRVVVVTTVGGWGVVAADAIAGTDLELATLPDDLMADIDALLPPRWSRNNPVDMAGGETRGTVPEIMRLAASHPDVDAVIFLGMGIQSNQAKLMREGRFWPDHGLERIVAFHERQDARYAEAAAEVSEATGKPVLVATELAITSPDNPGPAAVRATGRVCYPSANRAVVALDHLWRRALGWRVETSRERRYVSRDEDHTPRHFAGRSETSASRPPSEPGAYASRPEPERGGPPPSADDTDGDRPDAPRRGRWILPAALALLAVGCAAGAVALAADPAATAVGVDQVVATPVLSARRVPEAVAAPVADRRLTGDLQAWLADSPTDTCLVVANEGREVFEHNPDASVTGASTQKLITATGLLLALGPDATLRTEAVAAAPPSDGVVAGDLFVVGGGQADLGTPAWVEMGPGTRERVIHDVDALAAAVAAAGITRIDGSVVGDGTRYDDQRYQTSLAPRLIDQDQIGPIGGLMVNDGFAGFSPARTNADTVPAGDPAADAARVITERLQAHGITVAGAPRAGTAPEGAAAVATLESPPLSQIVADMLTTSDNETAEAALKEIGLATSGEGTWAAGVAGLTALLAEQGVALEGVQVADGSGLTIDNRLTCGTLVDVLTLEGTGPVVRDGLAVAGETGTLADRWTGTEVAGRLRGKTGTLRNVTALAGEVEPTQGGALTFAYVANVPDPGEVTSGEVGIDDLAHILVQYPRGVDMAALEPLPATPAG